jgi:hypothetical protein
MLGIGWHLFRSPGKHGRDKFLAEHTTIGAMR